MWRESVAIGARGRSGRSGAALCWQIKKTIGRGMERSERMNGGWGSYAAAYFPFHHLLILWGCQSETHIKCSGATEEKG